MLTDRSEQPALARKQGRLQALLLEKKQTADPSPQVSGAMSDRRQPLLSERPSRSGKKKQPRSSHSKEVAGLRTRGKFANKYLANDEQTSNLTLEQGGSKGDGSKHTRRSKQLADQKLDKINVSHIHLGTPRSVEEISLIEDKQAPAEKGTKKETKYTEISFNAENRGAEEPSGTTTNDRLSAAAEEDVTLTEQNNGPDPTEDLLSLDPVVEAEVV